MLISFDSKCLLFLCSTLCISNQTDPSFAPVLQRLANDVLKVKEFQEYLDQSVANPHFSSSAVNGMSLVTQISKSIQSSINKYTVAVQNLNTAIRSSLQTGGSDIPSITTQCCDSSATSGVDVRFRTPVDVSRFCTVRPSTSASTVIGNSVLQVMQRNLADNPTLKWQYFGGNDGSMYLYPASQRCPKQFDSRLQQWYYSTARSRDIVIMIDTSVSMGYGYGTTGISKLDVAKNAAVNIIKTLTPDDRVGVVAFDAVPTFPSGDSCYQRTLALATPTNKDILSTFISNSLLFATQPSDFSSAFQSAFSLFQATSTTNNVRVIVLLTDGKADSAEISATYRSIEMENAALNNSVTIWVFMILGSAELSANDPIKQFLTHVAQQDFPNFLNTTSAPAPSQLVIVTDPQPQNILSQIASYYDKFAIPISSSITFTVPYNDLTLGLITNACLPIVISTQLVGVTCVDISLDLVFNDVINFHLGELSYAYIIDGNGRTLIHPLLPLANTTSADQIYLDISSVETASGSDVIRASMISGGSGNLSLSVNMVAHRGNTQSYGVDIFAKPATYYWNSIPIMNYSVCLVIINNETKGVVTWNGPYPDVYLTQQMNINSQTENCNLYTRVGSKDKSGVYLSPNSFVEPFNISLVGDLWGPAFQQLSDYLEGRVSNAGNLSVQPGVRESVAMTHVLEAMWKNVSDPFNWDYVMLRYIGIKNGVFRMYPSESLPPEYDPTRRPWYSAADGSGTQGNIVIGPPYQDVSGIILLTLSQTIFDGSSSHADGDPIIGVIAQDFTLQGFYQLLKTQFDPCSSSSCFIIDSSGFVIIHPTYVTNPHLAVDHVTTKEPLIATDLVSNKIMVSDVCVNYVDISMQSFWKISSMTTKRSIASCVIYPVSGSNIFIIVPGNTGQVSLPCSCNIRDADGKIPCMANAACQCPCYSPTDYNYCSGLLLTNSTQWKPCVPPTTPLYLSDVTTAQIPIALALPDCRPCNISALATESSCKVSNKCCWNKANLTLGSCQDSCPGLISLTPGTDTPGRSHNTATVLGLAIGIPLGVLALVIIAVVIMVCYCCKNTSVIGTSDGVQRRIKSRPRHASRSWWSNSFGRQSDMTENVRPSDGSTTVHYLPDIAMRRKDTEESPTNISPPPSPKYDQPNPILISSVNQPSPSPCTPPPYMPNGVYLTTTATPGRRVEYESLRFHRENGREVTESSFPDFQDVRLGSTMV